MGQVMLLIYLFQYTQSQGAVTEDSKVHKKSDWAVSRWFWFTVMLALLSIQRWDRVDMTHLSTHNILVTTQHIGLEIMEELPKLGSI